MEFFTAEGRIAMTDLFYPTTPFDQVELFTENGTITATGEAFQLHSIWK